jgi:hypothetical protein
MITCNLIGGLGNQLFQIFATISYALENKTSFIFVRTETLGEGFTVVRPTYWNTFLSSLSVFTTSQLNGINQQITEEAFEYNTLGKPNGTITLINGYFQSYKYFEKHYNLICKLIKLNIQKNSIVIPNKDIKDINQNTISIHFRYGDYKKCTDKYHLLTFNYYKKSLLYILNAAQLIQANVLWFCEDHDLNDVTPIVNQLAKYYPICSFQKVNSEIPDWEQMVMMSLCNHNIIANSTFSWWGAYFNSNPDKIVCYPESWFVKSTNINTKDLCPPSWIKVSHIG